MELISSNGVALIKWSCFHQMELLSSNGVAFINWSWGIDHKAGLEEKWGRMANLCTLDLDCVGLVTSAVPVCYTAFVQPQRLQSRKITQMLFDAKPGQKEAVPERNQVDVDTIRGETLAMRPAVDSG
jgi:hypothetical protein